MCTPLSIRSEDGFRPGRVWSLWQMFELLAAPFVRAQLVLGGMREMANDISKRGGGRHKITHISGLEHNGFVLNARQLQKDAAQLGARITAGAAGRMVKLLESPEGYIMDDLAILLGQTVHFPEELEGRKFLCLSTDEAPLYVQARPLFGASVHSQFPGDARYEIGQAGKALALGLSTAGAFHAIRCLEAGIRALSRCLDIPDPTKASQRSWMKLLGAIKDAVDKKWPTNNDRMSGDGEFFDNAYAALAAMQNPWRNATMHLDQKYTMDEATNVFVVVRGFMKTLAARMDENGEPKA